MKPAKLTMDLDVEESFTTFDLCPDPVVEAAKKLFEEGCPETLPEAREIWKLSSKFMVTGPAFVETPDGPIGGMFVGFFMTRARDEKDNEKLGEMVRRAQAIQKKGDDRG